MGSGLALQHYVEHRRASLDVSLMPGDLACPPINTSMPLQINRCGFSQKHFPAHLCVNARPCSISQTNLKLKRNCKTSRPACCWTSWKPSAPWRNGWMKTAKAVSPHVPGPVGGGDRRLVLFCLGVGDGAPLGFEPSRPAFPAQPVGLRGIRPLRAPVP